LGGGLNDARTVSLDEQGHLSDRATTFNGINLGTYLRLATVAESIASGDHDQKLGFKASELGVPSDVSKWNGFR
jgi:hypothetical protein